MFDHDGTSLAHKMIKNLFPEDTRLAEFIGSLSLMFISILLSSHAIISIELTLIQREEFWSLVFFTFGFIQFISLIFYPKLELLRCVMSLTVGGALIWLGMVTNGRMDLSDITSLCLGLANLYSFIINTVQIRRVWER